MKKHLAFLAFALTLLLAGCSHPQPVYYGPPPPAVSAIYNQGYQDGLRAANHDLRAGLPPNQGRHARFDRPPVPPPAWGDYRNGFTNGYTQIFHQGPPPPPPGM